MEVVHKLYIVDAAFRYTGEGNMGAKRATMQPGSNAAVLNHVIRVVLAERSTKLHVGGGRGPVAPPVFKTGLAANDAAGGFDSLSPPPPICLISLSFLLECHRSANPTARCSRRCGWSLLETEEPRSNHTRYGQALGDDPPPFDDLGKLGIVSEGQHAASAALVRTNFKADQPSAQVNARPFQVKDFHLPPASQEGEIGGITKIRPQVFADLGPILTIKKTRTNMQVLDARKVRQDGYPALTLRSPRTRASFSSSSMACSKVAVPGKVPALA